MGKYKIVKNKHCTFYLEAKNVFVKINNSPNPPFILETRTPHPNARTNQLHDGEWLDLVDAIYKKKITDQNKFNEFIYSKYMLRSTPRTFK